jgi:hypothetical protein
MLKDTSSATRQLPPRRNPGDAKITWQVLHQEEKKREQARLSCTSIRAGRRLLTLLGLTHHAYFIMSSS